MATTTTKKTARRECALEHELRTALTGLGEDLRTGGRDLYGDVETLVRGVHRDTIKLGKALRGDIERLAKAGAPTPAPPQRTPRVPPAHRRTPARPKKAAA